MPSGKKERNEIWRECVLTYACPLLKLYESYATMLSSWWTMVLVAVKDEGTASVAESRTTSVSARCFIAAG